MESIAAGELIPPLATFLGFEAAAAVAARHGAGRSNMMRGVSSPARMRGRSRRSVSRSRSRSRNRGSTRSTSVRYRLGPTTAPALRSKFSKTPYWRTLGLRPGRYPSKKHVVDELDTDSFDKIQNVQSLIRVPYSDTEAMNARQGRLANVRGVKFRCWFQIKNQAESSTKVDSPLMVRWAILNPKENTGVTGDVGPTNFFISSDPTQEEAEDFPGTGTCFQFMNRQINRRLYGVMQQGKFVLHQDPSSNNSRLGMGAKKQINLWLPIKRQMKWPNNTTEEPNTNIYFVWWFCQMGDNTASRKYATSNDAPIEKYHEAVTYFKDSPGFN